MDYKPSAHAVYPCSNPTDTGEPITAAVQVTKEPKPQETITELKLKITELEAKLKTSNGEVNPRVKAALEIMRLAVRALKGQGPEDNIYSGMIDVNNPFERTRLDARNVMRLSAMETAAKTWPEYFGQMHTIAEQEAHTYISEEGLGRQEAILLQQVKLARDAMNLNINVPHGPEQQAQEQPQIQKKKHFWQR